MKIIAWTVLSLLSLATTSSAFSADRETIQYSCHMVVSGRIPETATGILVQDQADQYAYLILETITYRALVSMNIDGEHDIYIYSDRSGENILGSSHVEGEVRYFDALVVDKDHEISVECYSRN